MAYAYALPVIIDFLIVLFLYLAAGEGVVRGILYKIYSVDIPHWRFCAVYTDVMPHCRATQKQQKINDKNEF